MEEDAEDPGEWVRRLARSSGGKKVIFRDGVDSLVCVSLFCVSIVILLCV